MTTIRQLQRVIQAAPTSDGAGVKLYRSIGKERGLYLDPFLMLDEFGSENPGDYIAGFPSHPHRGFETVTYMLDGRMQHRDHLGNVGDLGPGSVQWMTAGRGVIHSEMPLQENGRMRGFQLWLNLPAKEKMKPASWQDIPADAMPLHDLANGGQIKVIAGSAQVGDEVVQGVINPVSARLSTDPLFLDVHLPAGASFEQAITDGHTALVYSYEGHVSVDGRPLPTRAAGVLTNAGDLRVTAGDVPTRFIVLAGRPLQEQVVQYGPFVMNTREQIEQAMQDYRDGVLTEVA
jgi:redox-sensitive bicupin YhaK (pirin superfamily)